MIEMDGLQPTPPDERISMRCPGCGKHSNFEAAAIDDLCLVNERKKSGLAGFRVCPACLTLLCFMLDTESKRLFTLPALRVDFDATNLPVPILDSLKEAIECHAHDCHVASAIIIRKTLELLCKDKQAKGKSLKDRIASLRQSVLIPTELLDAADELRLLGNDAAHVDSTVFDNVGKQEVAAAIGFAKEILKAVYQYSALLDQLRNLKK